MKIINFKYRLMRGFTVIELMLAMAVAAIILAIGVPSFQTFMETNLLASSMNQFIASLAVTRSEAIKRNQRVLLCASDDGRDCAQTGYENGWIIFVDSNANGARNNTEEIIRVNEPLAAGLTLRGNRGCCAHKVSYLASGRIAGIGGSIFLCRYEDTGKSRQIRIIPSGRVRLAQGAAKNCATS